MNKKSEFIVEVVSFDKAYWAPKNCAVKFKWAWRVLGTDNTTLLVGISNDTYDKVSQVASSATERLSAYRKGEHKGNVNPEHKNKPRRKSKKVLSTKPNTESEDNSDAPTEL